MEDNLNFFQMKMTFLKCDSISRNTMGVTQSVTQSVTYNYSVVDAILWGITLPGPG